MTRRRETCLFVLRDRSALRSRVLLKPTCRSHQHPRDVIFDTSAKQRIGRLAVSAQAKFASAGNTAAHTHIMRAFPSRLRCTERQNPKEERSAIQSWSIFWSTVFESRFRSPVPKCRSHNDTLLIFRHYPHTSPSSRRLKSWNINSKMIHELFEATLRPFRTPAAVFRCCVPIARESRDLKHIRGTKQQRVSD